MFDLTFLGTSASVPSADRNHPGLLVSTGNTRILVDCGEGTQRQLLRSGAGFRRLRRLLLTHEHLDHILGIPGLLSTMGTQQSVEKLVINGGPHTLQVVVRMLAGLWGEGQAPVPLELVVMSEVAVIQEGRFTITAFPVRHRDTDSFGYIFKSLMRRHLDRNRLALMRVPDGPIRKELAEGRRVTLPDGRIIEPADVLGPLESGSKLVVIGDAGTADGLNAVVGDADLLVIEATFLQQDAAIARSYGHLTAAQAASLAATSNVKRLILTHISGRYSAETILAEAKAIFTPVQIANDLEHIQV
jgi:ribonuclease Z